MGVNEIEMQNSKPSEIANPKRILCYSPYNLWALHGMWEMTILQALRLRGANVHYVLCDGLYSDCDVFWAATNPRHAMSCTQCQASAANLANGMKMPFVWLGRYLLPNDFREARQWAEGLLPDDFLGASYQGWQIGEWVASSVHSHLRVSELDFGHPRIQDAFRSYLYSGLIACRGIDRLLDDYAPDVLFLFNGRQSSTRVAFELARKRGIRVICHERGGLKESLKLTENLPSISLQSIEQAWQLWKNIPLEPAELERAVEYMRGRQFGKNLNWRSYSPEPQDVNSLRKQFGLNPNRPLLVLFNSSDDELIAHKEWQGPFPRQIDWIQKTVTFAETHPEADLIIRVHPNIAGKRATGNNFQQLSEFENLKHQLPSNGRLIMPDDPVSSYSLMDIATLGLVYMSTAGLEMACKGKQVIVAGGGWLYDQPFVQTVRSADAYEKMLESFLKDPPQDKRLDIMRMAYRYAYSVFFRLSVPFPLVRMPDPHTGELAYTSLEALLPGKEPNLDRVSRMILEGDSVFPTATAAERNRSGAEEEEWLIRHIAKQEQAVTKICPPPRVSVVIPCYNYGNYLEECVGSVIAQTYQDFEIIVVNDGSQDNTKEVAEQLIALHPDHRIKLINQANSGQPAISRNRGISEAKGEYILPLDADDMIAPSMLEECKNLLDEDSSIAIAYTDRLDFDGVTQIICAGDYDYSKLKVANHISYCALFRKEVWEKVGGYRTNIKGCEDWDFWVAAGAKGFYGRRIPRPLFMYRRHDTGVYQEVASRLSEKHAQIIINNREVYGQREIAAAENFLTPRSQTWAGEKPLVSVIIPTYNRPEKLLEALKSVLDQSYQHLEIIVINDGGGDVENIVTFMNRKGNILYVKHSQNRRMAAARNTGIQVARGKYIAYLDDDDIYYPDHIETLVRFLEGSDYKVAYTDAYRAHQRKENGRYIVTKRDLPYSFDFDPDRILFTNFIPTLCFMHEKACLDEVGLFDETITTQEDWDLWIRLSRKVKFAHIPRVTCEFSWREDGTTTTSSQGVDFVRTRKRIYEKYREFSLGKDQIVRAQEAFLRNFDALVQGEYAKAQNLIGDGKIEEAIAALEGLLRLSPVHSQALDDLGALYYQKGDENRALEYFGKALEGDPNNTNAMKNLADLCLQIGRPVIAVQFYRKILAAQPGDVDALLGVGNDCLQTGKIEEAKGFYEKVLKIEPENSLARRSLEALGHIPAEPAVSGSPQDPDRLPVGEENDLKSQEKPGKMPRVSIVIPVYNNMHLTQTCLQAIFQNTDGADYEIIIVDNASTDGTADFLRPISGESVKVLLAAKNMGFGEACNWGAQSARGEYLLFLNNDTEVQPGWLTALLQLAESTPDWGGIGSKLVYPDGRLQEAGGIIFADGNGWNYGRGMDPRDPRFNFVREVDYCSGAALMVRKDLWIQVGGFDRRYSPAYYEDADLCFEIRRLGYKVYYQPKSAVIHHEGRTAGTDLQSGFKRYQGMNRPKFMEKWSRELSQQFPSDPGNVVRASQRSVSQNILVMDPRLPVYDRASGSLRLLNILKCLRKLGFHVTYVAMDGFEAHRYVPILQDLGIEVYPGDRLALETFGYQVEGSYLDLVRILSERSYAAVVLSFWNLAEYYLPLIRKYSPHSKIIIDTVDIHFLRETREAKIKNSKDLEKKAMLTRKRETHVYQKADRLWVVTEEDRKAIEGLVGKVPIDIIPNAHQKVEPGKRYGDTSGLLFVGNFTHSPNADAAQYFCREVFPLIRKDLPDVNLYLVGSNPPEEVKAFASDPIVVPGYVEDLSPYLKRARISVNPLRYGAGMKGKIGEALSWGLPVVTTSIGAEGMGLADGEDALIDDSPGGFAAAVVRLYRDADLWNRLSANGKRKVEENWSLQSLQARLESVFRDRKKDSPGDLVSIIILVHNQLAYTQKCLESIFTHTQPPFELILVDNGSTDGTRDYLKGVKEGNIEVAGWRVKVGEDDRVVWRAETPKAEKRKGKGKGKKKRRAERREKIELACQSFQVIRNETNQGFALGNNQGMAAAKGDYILLLNNDVVVTPEWLSRMKAYAEKKPEIGIVGPMSNYVSGPQRVPEVSYDAHTLEGLDAFARLFAQRNSGQAQPFWRVVGFCMLIKRAVVEKIGGFDGRFGLGNFEDDDFSLRARLAGFESSIAGDCFVHHFGNRTFVGARIGYQESLRKNWEIFKQKWRIPAGVAYGAPYEMASIWKQGFDPNRHFCPLNPEEVSSSRGEELFGLGDMEGAKAVFHRIIQKDAQNVEALNNLGVIAFQQGKVDEALSYFRRALEIDPDHFESIENTGNCLLAQQEFKGAMEWLTRGLKLKPEDPGIRTALANCHAHAENSEKAGKNHLSSRPFPEGQTFAGKTAAAMDGAKAPEVERRIPPG